MNKILKNNNVVLIEAAIIEQLRRSGNVKLHPTLMNAPLIYNDEEKTALRKIYQGYINISLDAEIPFLMCTPTWRANKSRVSNSDINSSVNIDAVHFLQEIRNSHQSGKDLLKIGGMIGCKLDCYKPDEGLSAEESEQFHSWQISQLAEANPDFLLAATLPNVEEAKGIANAMEKTGIPYIISFVISRNGHILDGTNIIDAVDIIDSSVNIKPIGFMINCSYPTFLCANKQPSKLFNRLIGYQANASSLDHCDLDGAVLLEKENLCDWGNEMLKLNKSYGIKILGGCCGTGAEHLKYIVNHIHG
jgi:homocysteine S-methyltransferase